MPGRSPLTFFAIPADMRGETEQDELRRALEELTFLKDLALAIASLHSAQEVMRVIVHQSVRKVQAEQGVITLFDREEHASKTLMRTIVGTDGRRPYHPDQALAGWMQLNEAPLLLNDPHRDSRFAGTRFDASIYNLVCVPLNVRAKCIGMVSVYNKYSGFTDGDVRLLSIIASQFAQVVENARLYEEEQALESMRRELQVAREIQEQLLPQTVPLLAGYDLAGMSHPAQVVGGDYFDFIPVGPRQLGLCLGDVSGKGLPASLLMANVQAILRGQVLFGLSVKESLERANSLLCSNIRSGIFVTLVYGSLDAEAHTFRFANAGHNRPVLFSKSGTFNVLQEAGIPLGIKSNWAYDEAVATLAPGDLLLVYSDGITEAFNSEREEFGEERLLALVAKHAQEAAADVIEAILAAVRAHAGRAVQADDMTLIVAKRER